MNFFNIEIKIYTTILLIVTLSVIGSNIDCNGKAFHCVNSTHFKICVDLGGLSTTVDDFIITCPKNTVCKQYNLFECEYETTTLPPQSVQSDVTNEQFQTSSKSGWEQLDMTTSFPTKRQGMELSEKYSNKVTPASFLTDTIINIETSNDLNTSDINKPLNISQSIDKKVTFSTTQSGISVKQITPYNVTTLVTDIGVSSNYNNTQDIKTIDSLRNESLEPLNQSSLDLDVKLKVINSTTEAYSLSELSYSDIVTLLPSIGPVKEENTSRTENIKILIKMDNTTQKNNLDDLNKLNMTQLINSDSLKYNANSGSDIKKLISTTLSVTNNELLYDDVSNSFVTFEPSKQNIAETTTASYITIPGRTNQINHPIPSADKDGFETFFNIDLNVTTNVADKNISDNYVTSRSIIPEISTVKTNEMSSKVTNPELSYSTSSKVLNNSNLEVKTVATLKTLISDRNYSKSSNDHEILDIKNVFKVNLTTQLDGDNVSQFLTSTEHFLLHERSDINIPSISDIPSTLNISEHLNLSAKEATQRHNGSHIDNVINMENISINTDFINPNTDFFEDFVSTKSLKNHSNTSSLTVTNISLFTTATNYNIIDDYNLTTSKAKSTAKETLNPNLKLFDEIILEKTPNFSSTTDSYLYYSTVASESDFLSTNVDMLPALKKDEVPSETKTGLTESMSEKSLKINTTSGSLLLGNSTLPFTTVDTQPLTNNNIENRYSPSVIKVLSNLTRKDVIYETQTDLNVYDQLLQINKINNVSGLNSLTLNLNNSVTPESNIVPSNYNNTLNVMENYSSTIVDTLPTLITKINVTSNYSSTFKVNETDEEKSTMNNRTLLEQFMATVDTDPVDSKVTASPHKSSISESTSDFVLKNETLPKPVIIINAKVLENNITTTEPVITTEMFSEFSNLKLISTSTSKQQLTVSELLMVTDILDSIHKENISTTTTKTLTDHQSFVDTTTSLSSPTKIPDYIFKSKIFNPMGLITSTDSVISDSERNTTTIISNLPTTLDKPTMFMEKISGVLDNNNKNNDNTSKLVINSLYKVNEGLTYTSRPMSKMSDEYETRPESLQYLNDTAGFEFANLTNVINDTYANTDVLSELGIVSDDKKSIKNISELTTTINSSMYYDRIITSGNYVIYSETTVPTLPLEFNKKEINKEQVNHKNATNPQVLDESIVIRNPSLTKSTTENILITNNNFSLSVDLNNNLTDKSNKPLRDVEGKPNQLTNTLMEISTTVDVKNINDSDFKYNEENAVSPVSNNFKISSTNSHITDIYNESHNNFSLNRTKTSTFKTHEANFTESSKKNKTNTELEGKNYKYLLNNTYKLVETKPKGSSINNSNITNEKSVNNVNSHTNRTESYFQLNVNLSLITTHDITERINKTNVSEINNGNRSKTFVRDKNITNNRGFVSTKSIDNATKPTETYNKNVSKTKSINVIGTDENYNNIKTDSKTIVSVNNLLKNNSSQTNLITNKTLYSMSASTYEFGRTMPSELNKSLQSTVSLFVSEMVTKPLFFNVTKAIREEDKIISNNTNRSKVIEKIKLRNNNVYSESRLDDGVTKNIENNTRKAFITPINNYNNSHTKFGNNEKNEEFICTKRGKYSFMDDCNKFYICMGRFKPIIGVCPRDTVFSEFLKQCTRNVTHCIRNNQFRCTSAGRFYNILSNKTYFICARKKIGFIRFTLQCQNGYYLNRNNLRCTPEFINISISDESSSKNTRELSSANYRESEKINVDSKNYFECEKEGKFQYTEDCRKYYVCKNGRKSTLRRKIKKCDSDEVFHVKKKKCVDAESYECNL